MVKMFEKEGPSEARPSSNKVCVTGPGDVDNKHLPIGDNIAILVVGKTKYIRQTALHTLKTRVLSRYPNVFVHVSPTSWGEAGNETREAQHVYQSVHEHLKALVITSEKYGHDHLKLESSLCEDVHQDHAPSRGRGNEGSMWEPVSAAHYRSPAV